MRPLATLIVVCSLLLGSAPLALGDEQAIKIQSALPVRVSASLQQNQKRLAADLNEETQTAADALENFCRNLSWDCARFQAAEVVFTREPLGLTSESLDRAAGTFTPPGLIRVSLASEDRSVTLFHELVHWAHYQSHLSESEVWNHFPANSEWVLEAIPFMANLLFHPEGRGLTGSERNYLARELSGSLAARTDSTEWYGLTALWVRYLERHLANPLALLREWAGLPLSEIGNGDWRRTFDFGDFEFVNERAAPLAATDKRFENLFQYFAISLYENSPGINAWNLFQTGLPGEHPPIEASAERWLPLVSGVTFELEPMGFRFAHPGSLSSPLRLEGEEGARIVLWRGSRFAPEDINGDVLQPSAPSRQWERVLIYNPTTRPLRISIGGF